MNCTPVFSPKGIRGVLHHFLSLVNIIWSGYWNVFKSLRFRLTPSSPPSWHLGKTLHTYTHVCVTSVHRKLTFISSSYIDSDHLNQILPLHHAHCTFEQHDQGLGRQDTREGGEWVEGKLTQYVSTHLYSVFLRRCMQTWVSRFVFCPGAGTIHVILTTGSPCRGWERTGVPDWREGQWRNNKLLTIRRRVS